MKKSLLFICLCLSTMLMAQEKQEGVEAEPVRQQLTPVQQAQKHTTMLTRILNLSEQQVDTVYLINLKYAELRQETDTREQKQRLFEQMVGELKGVLTEEQFKVFEQMQQLGPKNRPPQLTRKPKEESMVR